jgi:hypothetical protein
MVPPDHDGRGHFAARDEIIEDSPHCRPFAVAEPADPGRESLEVDLFPRAFYPPAERRVLRKRLQDRPVRPVDVVRVTREGRPTERAFAITEKGSDVLRNESGNVERILHAIGERFTPDIVPVVKRHRSPAMEPEHRTDVLRD